MQEERRALTMRMGASRMSAMTIALTAPLAPSAGGDIRSRVSTAHAGPPAFAPQSACLALSAARIVALKDSAHEMYW